MSHFLFYFFMLLQDGNCKNACTCVGFFFFFLGDVNIFKFFLIRFFIILVFNDHPKKIPRITLMMFIFDNKIFVI